jgi:probable O-glycosylation ligase (exosortase A-associated)
MWVWFSIMNPHQQVFGFAHDVPWNLLIAAVTLASWLASNEPKRPPGGLTIAAILALLAWTTLNTFFAFEPAFSWPYWNLAWKTLAMCIVASTLAGNRVRFQALMWIVALALSYYAVKGGIFTIFTGGHYRVLGPPDSMLGDNNELGLALVMVLPVLNYLRVTSASRFVHFGLIVVIVLTLASILGSYSRETYIALGVLAVAFFWRSRRKLLYIGTAVTIITPLLLLMPQSFYDRAASILEYNTDASFRAHLDSWWVAYRYAMDHAPFGAGFYGLNLKSVWNLYIPGDMHAAHSIYFQALGEQGIIGLLLYLTSIALGFLNLRGVMRSTRGRDAQQWAYSLGDAMQLGLLAFCVGGAAAPMAFFDLLFLWIALSAALRELTKKQPSVQRTTVELRDSYQEALA